MQLVPAREERSQQRAVLLCVPHSHHQRGRRGDAAARPHLEHHRCQRSQGASPARNLQCLSRHLSMSKLTWWPVTCCCAGLLQCAAGLSTCYQFVRRLKQPFFRNWCGARQRQLEMPRAACQHGCHQPRGRLHKCLQPGSHSRCCCAGALGLLARRCATDAWFTALNFMSTCHHA